MYADTPVSIETGAAVLEADLTVPEPATGLVVFAHGSGSSRHSPRNRMVAARLHDAGFATVLVDLLTLGEERLDEESGELRFDIGLLAARVAGVIDWAGELASTRRLPLGLFGASTGAAAALVAAAARPDTVRAVVSRGGRPDLAGATLSQVRSPTLLLVGELDTQVLRLNEEAASGMTAIRQLRVVPGATHLFPEPGALEQVASWATGWFAAYLRVGGGAVLDGYPEADRADFPEPDWADWESDQPPASPRGQRSSPAEGLRSDFPEGQRSNSAESQRSDFPGADRSDLLEGRRSGIREGDRSTFAEGRRSDFPEGPGSDFPEGRR